MLLSQLRVSVGLTHSCAHNMQHCGATRNARLDASCLSHVQVLLQRTILLQSRQTHSRLLARRGGFIKRDGRMKQNDTLTSRLIDRPLRPMFPAGWFHDTQVRRTVACIT